MDLRKQGLNETGFSENIALRKQDLKKTVTEKTRYQKTQVIWKTNVTIRKC